MFDTRTSTPKNANLSFGEETHHRKLALRHSGRFDMDKQDITYRTATAADVDDILTIFGEVAPEVPTKVRTQTKELVEGWVAMGASLVALDSDGKVVGYALTRDDGKGGIELVYLGVTGAARGKRVCSGIVARLKEHDMPITASVRDDNQSSMAGRFERLGFKVLEKQPEQTKFRWKPVATQNSSQANGYECG
jgi:N-acetylglutamate synthase-like GNAT family acetyltransferase